MKKLILIGICTYKRNELLLRALSYISKLITPVNCKIEIVISDNNPDKSAKNIYKELKNFPFKIHYIHEPNTGIANARNAVLKKALQLNVDYIAFLDDDEYPTVDWITELYNVMVENDANISTSAPVRIINGKEQPLPLKIKSRKNGETRYSCATSSVLFTIDIVKKSEIWFDTAFGSMTGEDIDFFSRAANKGYKIVWCAKKLIYDELPAIRQTLEWKLDRAFNNGYLKIFLRKKNGKTNFNKDLNKSIFELLIFASLYFLFGCNKKIKEHLLIKIATCSGKFKSIFSDKPYSHYKN